MNSKNNKTFVILTPGFAASEADSTCLPMHQNFVKNLKDNYPYLDIVVLTFQYPYHTKIYKWFGLTVMSFNGRNKGGFTKLLLRRKINAALKKINNKSNIAGLLSFWYGECALIGKNFADHYQLKHHCWILGQDARKENKYPHQVHAAPGELIALSDFLQDEFKKNHGVKPQHVIPFGIDEKKLTVNFQEKDIDIIGAGSLIPLKQFDIFLEIIAAIKPALPSIKVTLAGEGPEREKLSGLISSYGLGDNVSLTGELAHEHLLALMARSKILLHTSSYEGFSGVCLEALSHGARVISFCKAMKQEITSWHIADSKEDMIRQTLIILKNKDSVYLPSIPFSMKDTIIEIMKLYS